ncbi:MAG: hypothetical protein BWX88_05339 [Planctomycetes bacterium ADurb.Bin126]|nr:MAG: hypothetical protein BWX88_05339 [Planctomycetes bacterium ADurb.Bin126]
MDLPQARRDAGRARGSVPAPPGPADLGVLRRVGDSGASRPAAGQLPGAAARGGGGAHLADQHGHGVVVQPGGPRFRVRDDGAAGVAAGADAVDDGGAGAVQGPLLQLVWHEGPSSAAPAVRFDGGQLEPGGQPGDAAVGPAGGAAGADPAGIVAGGAAGHAGDSAGGAGLAVGGHAGGQAASRGGGGAGAGDRGHAGHADGGAGGAGGAGGGDRPSRQGGGRTRGSGLLAGGVEATGRRPAGRAGSPGAVAGRRGAGAFGGGPAGLRGAAGAAIGAGAPGGGDDAGGAGAGPRTDRPPAAAGPRGVPERQSAIRTLGAGPSDRGPQLARRTGGSATVTGPADAPAVGARGDRPGAGDGADSPAAGAGPALPGDVGVRRAVPL